jgi:hypothetical protein
VQLNPIGPNAVNSPSLDIKKLVTRFGGRIELWRRMKARGFDLSVKTIEKWGERDSVPANRLLQLLELAKYENKPINLNDFVRAEPNSVRDLSPHRHENEKSKVVPH